MWIESERFHDDGRPVTVALKLPEMDEPVRFSSAGTAQVTEEVGKLLIDEIESISKREGEDEEESNDEE